MCSRAAGHLLAKARRTRPHALLRITLLITMHCYSDACYVYDLCHTWGCRASSQFSSALPAIRQACLGQTSGKQCPNQDSLEDVDAHGVAQDVAHAAVTDVDTEPLALRVVVVALELHHLADVQRLAQPCGPVSPRGSMGRSQAWAFSAPVTLTALGRGQVDDVCAAAGRATRLSDLLVGVEHVAVGGDGGPRH